LNKTRKHLSKPV